MRAVLILLLFTLPVVSQILPGRLSGRSWSFRSAGAASDWFNGLVPTNGLISYWRMDESSPGTNAVTRVDSFSGYNLTDNSPFAASTTGIITNAVDLELSNSEYLSKTDNADLSLGTNVPFSVVAWVNMESKVASGSISVIASKDGNTSGTREWNLFYNGTADRFSFLVGRTGSATTDSVTSTNLGSPSTGTNYMVVGTFEPSANTLRIYVNTNAVDTFGAKTIDPPDSSQAVQVGRYGTTSYWDGGVDEVSVWKTVLSSANISNLWNGGAGLDLRRP